MIVNLDEADVPGAVPMDYFIHDINQPRDLAVRDGLLYLVGEGNEGGNWKRFLMILDVSSLTPLTDNDTTIFIDKDDDGLVASFIEVGNSPQTLLLTTDYVFVTNMGDDTVSVIDLAARTVVAEIDVGSEPFSLALYTTADGVEQYVYVGNLEGNTISIIDIPSLTVVTTFP